MHFTRAERKIIRKKRKLMICRVTFLIQADLCPSLPPLGRAQLSCWLSQAPPYLLPGVVGFWLRRLSRNEAAVAIPV